MYIHKHYGSMGMDGNGIPSLKLTCLLKMDGWNTILSYWVSAYFQGRTVSFREGIYLHEWVFFCGK